MTYRPLYYRLDGHQPTPCDRYEFGRMLEDEQTRRVAWDEIAPGVTVSTVFLGIDHSFGHGPPVLFETMVFDDYEDGEQDRYCTWEAAEAGHSAIVARVRAHVLAATNTKSRDALK
jgi:CTP:molybdopterin cytidylyltransferase MocA